MSGLAVYGLSVVFAFLVFSLYSLVTPGGQAVVQKHRRETGIGGVAVAFILSHALFAGFWPVIVTVRFMTRVLR